MTLPFGIDISKHQGTKAVKLSGFYETGSSGLIIGINGKEQAK